MSLDQYLRDTLIWATRGRSWGFRFLLNGGLSDPLPTHEGIFSDLEDEPTAWRRADGMVALRFSDPEGRRDAAGRVIPHEFVVFGSLADDIGSADDGLRQVWPLVAEAYAQVWDAKNPPSAADLDLVWRSNTPPDAAWRAERDSGDEQHN